MSKMSFKFNGLDQLQTLNVQVPQQVYQELNYRRNQINENELKNISSNIEKASKDRLNLNNIQNSFSNADSNYSEAIQPNTVQHSSSQIQTPTALISQHSVAVSQQVSSVATSLSSIQVRQPSVQSNQLAVNFPNQVVSASSNSNFSGPTPPGKRMQPGSQPSSLKLPASQTYSYNSGLTFSSSHPASYFATPPPGEQVYPNQQLLYSRNLSHPPSYFT